MNGNVHKSIKPLLHLLMLSLFNFFVLIEKLEVCTVIPIALSFKLLANNGVMKEIKDVPYTL